MREGTIVQWFKAIGDFVSQGEPLVEVEAAKVTDVIHAPVSGRLVRLHVSEGETVRVQALLAEIAPIA